MSESPRRVAVVVGMFVTVGVILLSGGILAIGNLNETFTRKITVTAVFEEVNGLQNGDNIWFSGVKVGRVKEMRFEGAAQVEVEMKVDRAAAEFIRKDSLAKIGSDGPIGSKLVILYGGSPKAPHLEDGDVMRIGENVNVDAMMKTFQQTNDNLLDITDDLKILTAGLVAGDGTAGKLFSDDVLATQIVDTVTTMQAASVDAQRVTANLSTFSAKLNRPGSLPNDIVTDKTLYPSLVATAGKLDQVATDASAVVAGIEKSTGDTNTAVGALLHDEKAGTDMKQTLANLSDGTRLLNEDLEAAQHSFLLRRAFKKKAKADAKEKSQAADVQ